MTQAEGGNPPSPTADAGFRSAPAPPSPSIGVTGESRGRDVIVIFLTTRVPLFLLAWLATFLLASGDAVQPGNLHYSRGAARPLQACGRAGRRKTGQGVPAGASPWPRSSQAKASQRAMQTRSPEPCQP